MTALSIIGAGGHGKVVAEIAERCGYREVTFLDKDWPQKTENGRWSVVGDRPDERAGPFFCAIGNNATRARLSARYGLEQCPVLVDPAALISASVHPGAGTVAMAGVVINVDAVIGRGSILNTGCSVDHDCALGDFVHVSPGARLAGGVIVGNRSWIGIGAVVREGVRIGADVLVAAGAVVVTDVPDGARIMGVPAQPFRG